MPKRLSSSVKVFYPNYSRSQLVDVLQERLPSLNKVLPIKKVVLFGSWAAGKETAFSDIDLLVVYSGPFRQEAYKMVKYCLNIRGLEPHVFAEKEAEGSRQTLERMTKEGIVLFPFNKAGLPTINDTKNQNSLNDIAG